MTIGSSSLTQKNNGTNSSSQVDNNSLTSISSSIKALSAAASNLVSTIGKAGNAVDDTTAKAADATKQINDAFATTASGGLSDFLKGVASGKSALQSLSARSESF